MQDGFLYAAGLLGVAISIVHGYLGNVRVVQPVETPTRQAKRLLHAIMFLSAVYWFVASMLLVATPELIDGNQRSIVVYGVALVFLSGAIGNFWATRGRHFGWMLLCVAYTLAIAGA